MFSFGASPSTCCATSDESSSISRHLSSGPSDCTSGNLSRSIDEDIPQNARSRIQAKFQAPAFSSVDVLVYPGLIVGEQPPEGDAQAFELFTEEPAEDSGSG